MGGLKSKAVHKKSSKYVKRSYSNVSHETKNEMKKQLIEACNKGNLKKMETLLERGVPVNFTISHNLYEDVCPLDGIIYDSYPLESKMMKNRTDVLLLFLKYGVDLNYCDIKERNIVHKLCNTQVVNPENVTLLKILIENGARLAAKDSDGNTPLHYCCMDSGSFDKKMYIKLLLNEPTVNVNEQNKEGMSPLHYCARAGNSNIAKLLLDRNAQINLQNFSGGTPLHEVFSRRSYYGDITVSNDTMVKTLLTAGADVNLCDHHGVSSFRLALDAMLNNHDKQLFNLFIQKGADLRTLDSKGNTLLHLCYQTIRTWFHWEIDGKEYIKNGFNGNVQNRMGKIPLEYCLEGILELVPYGNEAVPYVKHFCVILKSHIQAGADLRNMTKSSQIKFERFLGIIQKNGYHDVVNMVRECGFHYFNMYSDFEIEPRLLSLQRMSANCIRLSLRPNAVVSIDSLGLPKKSRDYVMFD